MWKWLGLLMSKISLGQYCLQFSRSHFCSQKCVRANICVGYITPNFSRSANNFNQFLDFRADREISQSLLGECEIIVFIGQHSLYWGSVWRQGSKVNQLLNFRAAGENSQSLLGECEFIVFIGAAQSLLGECVGEILGQLETLPQ